jgi:predicted nucleic acid-binding protein
VGVALLDSSAVVAYLYADDALHVDAVDAIEGAMRGGASLAISAVTWAELLNGADIGHQEQEVVRGFIGEFGITILAVDAVVAEQAAALQGAYARTGRGRDRPRLRTPDALILATAATRDDIDAVICGDAKWPKVPGVTQPIRLLRERRTR